MRILAVHNRYQQRGGEDVVFEDETRLLESHGLHVVRFIKNNHELHRASNWKLTSNTIWNRAASEELAAVVRSEKIDVVHCHNLFPILSPACFRAARKSGAAMVHTCTTFAPSALKESYIAMDTPASTALISLSLGLPLCMPVIATVGLRRRSLHYRQQFIAI